jgi:serine/threonine protein kinase
MEQQMSRRCMGCMGIRGDQATCPECGFDESKPPQIPFSLPVRTMLNDQYLIGRALGAGGFAITYLAWDTRLARRVAIKEYMPSGLASRSGETSQVVAHTGQSQQDFKYGLERFLDEGRTVAQFEEHPGIISVINFFPANGTAYLVMEYLEGRTLKEHLAEKGGRLPFNEALAILTPVMDALRELHRHNVLHRDVSPDNIYITNNGQVKLLDFGAARQALQDRSQHLSVILKEGYAPEEQYRSTGNQGPWTDVYAVGATMYHLTTGTLPPQAIDRLAQDTIQLPSALGADIPPAAEDALMTALAVRAAQRYPTIQDFQAAIGLPGAPTRLQSAPSTVKGPALTIPPWWPKAAIAAGGVVVLVTTFLVVRHIRTGAKAIVAGTANGVPSSAAPANVPGYVPGYAPPQFQISHAGEIAPLKDSWPPNDLESIVQKGLARAQKWSPDAELIELKLDIQDHPTWAPMYVQTSAGPLIIQLTYYSPSMQKAMMLTPNALNSAGQTDGDFYSIGYVSWGSWQHPLPSKFIPLSQAITKAQLKGMRGPTIKTATLTNWSGTFPQGFAWLLTSVFSDENPFAIRATPSSDSGAGGE